MPVAISAAVNWIRAFGWAFRPGLHIGWLAAVLTLAVAMAGASFVKYQGSAHADVDAWMPVIRIAVALFVAAIGLAWAAFFATLGRTVRRMRRSAEWRPQIEVYRGQVAAGRLGRDAFDAFEAKARMHVDQTGMPDALGRVSTMMIWWFWATVGVIASIFGYADATIEWPEYDLADAFGFQGHWLASPTTYVLVAVAAMMLVGVALRVAAGKLRADAEDELRAAASACLDASASS